MTEFKLTLQRVEADGQTSELHCAMAHETGTLPARKLMAAVDMMFECGRTIAPHLLVPILEELTVLPVTLNDGKEEG